jgi:hypothetical protein
MPTFTFTQNSSGGYLIGPKQIVVEAPDSDTANEIAQEEHGVYFDGVSKLIDCECCGNR